MKQSAVPVICAVLVVTVLANSPITFTTRKNDVSSDCVTKYMKVLEQLAKDMESEHEQCEKTAVTKRETLQQEIEADNQNYETRTQVVIADLQKCVNYTDPSQQLHCYKTLVSCFLLYTDFLSFDKELFHRTIMLSINFKTSLKMLLFLKGFTNNKTLKLRTNSGTVTLMFHLDTSCSPKLIILKGSSVSVAMMFLK